jgi:arylsulfatase A-like enzyme
MSRPRAPRWRRLTLVLAVALAVTPATLLPPPPAGAPALAATQADIVLILADDMSEDDWRSLPETRERLPAVFPNYINTDPICCPSRASILRGQYPHSHGTWGSSNNSPTGGWKSFRDQEDATIGIVLRGAGYHTGLIGKYLNGYLQAGKKRPGWNYWFALVDGQKPNEGKYFKWKAVEGNDAKRYGGKKQHYSTDVIARKAVQFVIDAPGSQPLFAIVAPYAPHNPATVAPRHQDSCHPGTLPARQKPSFNEADMSDKPAYMRDRQIDADKLEEFDRKRQCSLKALDELVVRVNKALAARGRPYDLIVASDNGYLMGEHRRVGKDVPYEEAIRTTLRATGPDFPAGTDTRLIGNIDLAPTFAQIAGAPARDDWDGRSFLGGLDREVIAIERRGNAAPSEDDMGVLGLEDQKRPQVFQGFRGANGIVYIEYVTGEVELYDLDADPYQLNNLAVGKTAADFPDYHDRSQELRDCHAAACWEAEDAPLGQP